MLADFITIDPPEISTKKPLDLGYLMFCVSARNVNNVCGRRCDGGVDMRP